MASGTPAPAAKKPRATRKPAASNGRARKPTAAKVAAAEVTQKQREPVVESFNGVEITFPAELPMTFMLDYADMQDMQVGQDPRALGQGARLVKSVIGEGQWQQVRESMVGQTGADGGAKIIGDLLSLVFDVVMNMEPGESPASGTP